MLSSVPFAGCNLEFAELVTESCPSDLCSIAMFINL